MLYIPSPFKRCSKAGQCVHPDGPILFANSENFFVRKNRNNTLAPACRACERERTKRYHETHRESEIEYNRRYCAENPEKRRESERKWKCKNRERVNQTHSNWRKRNAEEQREIARKRYADSEDVRKKALETNRDYRRREKQRVNERNRGWHREHPGNARFRVAKRRTVKLSLPVAFDDKDWQQCLDYWQYRCVVCGRPSGLWHTLAADHWIPLQPDYELSNPNPGTVPENIIPLCNARAGGEDCCNQSKGNRDPIEWLIEKVGKRQAKVILNRIQDYFDSVKG